MKIYTKTGDQGTTGLFGGDRVDGGHRRIDAYGTVDEVNAVVGQARAALQSEPAAGLLDPILARIQGELFVLGADLATPVDARAAVPRMTEPLSSALERDIDAMEADLTPLKNFILPGGTPCAALLHAARTVCRRAERLTVALSRETSVNAEAVVYLNRLSDFFFVAARWTNLQSGVEDLAWIP